MSLPWENIIYENIIDVPSDGSGIQYYSVSCAIPDNYFRDRFYRPEMRDTVVDITLQSFITRSNGNILYAGYIFGVLGMYPGQHLNPLPPNSFGGQIPLISAGGAASPVLDSVTYESVGLPFGATQIPIWTRQAIDPLTVPIYADWSRNRGAVVGRGFLQLIDNTVESFAIEVNTRLFWQEHQS